MSLNSMNLIASYFNRKNVVSHDRWRLHKKEAFQNGIPQGSLLGSVLFILYTSDIEAIIMAYGIKPYLSSITFRIWDEVVVKIETCIAHVMSWMKIN